ncbi:MAG: DUF4159 domain-containing protein [Bacteroidota bacterium]
MKQPIVVILLLTLSSSLSHGQPGAVSSSFKLARLKYSGGGDWYNDPSSDVNLLKFVQEHTTIDVDPKYEFVEISSENFFSYPMVWLTGHGNIVFSDSEIRRLRTYLEKGGFVYVDDDYGLDRAFRREIKKVFPDEKLVELPFSHGIYHTHFSFPNGLPKIHRHEGRPPQGFGLFLDGRLAVFYTYECNLGDGWADPQVHNDPEDKRLAALRMGTNIIVWALTR